MTRTPHPVVPLRVAMLIPYDLEYQPFTIRSIRFAEELARRGHQVRLFYRRLPARRRDHRVHLRPPAGVEVDLLPGARRGGWRTLAQAIAQADVVHFQKSRPPCSLIAVGLGRLHHKPLHWDWDDDDTAFWWQATRDAWSTPTLRPTQRVLRIGHTALATAVTGAFEWLLPKVVDTLGGASMALRRKSVGLGCPPRAVFPARVGVDLDVFGPERRDDELRRTLGLRGPTVIYAGSLDVQPDLHFFVAALRSLVDRAPETQVLVLGGGFGRKRFVELITEQNLSAAVVMTPGLVPFAEMPRYLASCDVAALPFRDTAINRAKSSLTLLECMASGVAVVTHDVGDASWMLDGGGVLARPDDPGDFGAQLAALARDPVRRAELTQAARRRVEERFSWQQSTDYLEQAYCTAIDRRRERPLARER